MNSNLPNVISVNNQFYGQTGTQGIDGKTGLTTTEYEEMVTGESKLWVDSDKTIWNEQNKPMGKLTKANY